MPKSEQIKPTGVVVSERQTQSRVLLAPSPSTAGTTESQVYDPGITYNEAGLTYNEIGYAYGGVYGSQDVRPLVSLAQDIRPSMTRGFDAAGTADGSGNSGYLVGILGLTYP